MNSLCVELTEQGYLLLAAPLATKYFPEDVAVAFNRDPELWMLPLRSANAGGLLLKQRNLRGDRSVLVWEVLPPDVKAGNYAAFWDAEQHALRIALRAGES
ncbi:MAG: hydrogenase maturation protease [Acidobacteria bacterium]|nr:hydrogenase maturation protease [Acidobacteriota bacterium]